MARKTSDSESEISNPNDDAIRRRSDLLGGGTGMIDSLRWKVCSQKRKKNKV